MYGALGGAPFHGEFSSADASALSEPNGRILLYGAGSTTAVTLGATDQVAITDVKILVGSSAITVTVYDGANNAAGAGEVVTTGEFAANGGEAQNFSTPHYCQVGTYPKVITSGAGSVKVQIRGFINRLGS
jgi:hypothetical protein